MTPEPPDPEQLNDAVRKRRERRAMWEREGERSIGQNLALIGSLGWMIIVPLLGGIFIGRWLDRQLETGILWTAALLVIGLAAGCWLAWKRMQRE